MTPAKRGRRRTRRWWRAARRVGMAAQNALEIIRAGRLSTPYSAPYDVVHTGRSYTLRRYQGARVARAAVSGPLLLVPPLMVASEVYDIGPDSSAVAALVRAGIDVWLADFGAPEAQEGGLSRTLDDHLLAVSDAVDRARSATERDVHLAGYSQGGMFVYQAAAYRRSAGIASLITFGSPVDIHRGVPNVSDAVIEPLVNVLRATLGGPLDRVEGLPGALTSWGFRLFSVRKELGQLVDFVRKLHDRQALEERESKRLFLRGEGFVAWPGPAFRTFVEDLVVANRMTTGGFVVDGRPITLADIHCPILCFLGSRDDMASEASVRAIRRAAPNANIYERWVKAGHFGLVVGSQALTVSWPTVVDWIRWREDPTGEVPRPDVQRAEHLAAEDGDELASLEEGRDLAELAWDILTQAAQASWNRLGEGFATITDSVHRVRHQLPRLARLRSLEQRTRVSLGRALDEQARHVPEHTFFLWGGRAFSYAVANARVDNVVRGLVACGVEPGQRAGVLMRRRPSYLSIVTALNRLGAVAVLLDPKLDDAGLARALVEVDIEALITDPEHASRGRTVHRGAVLVLGGGGDRPPLVPGVVDLEVIDPDAVVLPRGYDPNPGRARDLATLLVSAPPGGDLRVAGVTNHRWAFSAYGAAATTTLTWKDTVYACLPLHHVAGGIVSAGSALVGGARLALAAELDPRTFWSEARRYGATVVFYAGEMCRQLVDAPPRRGERDHPVRLFAGSGMRRDVWERLVARFGVGVLEYYASTETNAVLANASGEKIGSVGRQMPGSSELELVEWDLDRGEAVRDPHGLCVPCAADQLGMLLARLDDPPAQSGRVVRNVQEPGDAWYNTGDLMRRDGDGDYWLFDSAADLIDTPSGRGSPRAIEDALYRLADVTLAVAYGVPCPDADGREAVAAAVVLRAGTSLDPTALEEVRIRLAAHERPRYVRCVDRIPLTDGYRPQRSPLRAAGIPPDPDGRTLAWNGPRGTWERLASE